MRTKITSILGIVGTCDRICFAIGYFFLPSPAPFNGSNARDCLTPLLSPRREMADDDGLSDRFSPAALGHYFSTFAPHLASIDRRSLTAVPLTSQKRLARPYPTQENSPESPRRYLLQRRFCFPLPVNYASVQSAILSERSDRGFRSQFNSEGVRPGG